ncbi:PAS domain-containing protein [Pseudooctadecabacter sp.]|uniref:PAS domain-containing protein n=1 Tax=Pseudooctadecabacter sp. TaxID=1966338 RepID=UPI0025D9A615|nr:PAS domain-containing protein [Pseudooctadecabacter sp.]
MSMTFDPYKLGSKDVAQAEDVIMTNPTALNELERYWTSLPRRLGVPSRADLDPVAMGRQLEDSFILERVAPGVARVRVAGRNIGKLIGMEPRGLPMTAIMLPASRAAMSNYIEAAFTTPAIVELPLTSPRAVGQPVLQGKILLLPLRDDHGQVTRLLGVLVMSGRRGMGGRRFDISDVTAPRVDPVTGLTAVEGGRPARTRPSLRVVTDPSDTQKAKDTPALRLVVSNP